MTAKIQFGDAELASSSFWLPSPNLQDNPISSITRTCIGASTGKESLRPGDWRRAAAADTDGEPVQVPSLSGYTDSTPNIDDVHSPASTSFDSGAGSGLPSPLAPRALASSGCSGRGHSYAGNEALLQQQGSPSSIASLSAGEASFRLGSPAVDQFPVPKPSEVSPVQIRRFLPPGSELSTPGSDAYDSPSVLFAIQPSSLMRSSVHNPLYVDRPASPEVDTDVAKALVLSPCADRSPASRAPRSTVESCWSSSSISMEQSISLNPSQHDDRATPPPHNEATSSPALLSACQLLASEPSADWTPRRIIKNLSGATKCMAAEVDLGAVTCAMSPRMQIAQSSFCVPALANNSTRRVPMLGGPGTTPCSAALSVRFGVEVGALGSSCSSPTTDQQCLSNPSSLNTEAKQADVKELACTVDSPNGRQAVDLDDTVLTGRMLDQSPCKGSKVSTQARVLRSTAASDALQQVPVKQQRHDDTVQQQRQHTSTPRHHVEPQHGKRRGAMLLALASWALLLGIVTLGLLGLQNNSSDRWSTAPRAVSTLSYNTGPVCFPERYPAADSMTPVTTALDIKFATMEPFGMYTLGLPSIGCSVPFCWSHLPNCHHLDQLISPAQWQSAVIIVPVADSVAVPDAAERAAYENSSELVTDALASLEQLAPASAQLILPASGVGSPVTLPDSIFELQSRLSTVAPPEVEASVIASAQVFGEEASNATVAIEEPCSSLHPVEEFSSPPPVLDITNVGFGSVNAEASIHMDQNEQDPAFSPNYSNLAREPATEVVRFLLASEGAMAQDHVSLIESVTEGPAADTKSSISSVEVFLAHDEPSTAGPYDSAPASVAVSFNVSLPEASSVVDVIGNQGLVNDVTALGSLFAKRLYGWNLPEFLFGIVGACLAGWLLVWTVEYLSPSIHRRYHVRHQGVDGSSLQATAQPALAGRILRPKRAQDNSKAEQATQDMRSAADFGDRSVGTGSFIWTGNKLVYMEG